MGVRLAVCAVVMIALLANTATPIYAAGGEVGSIQGTVVDSVTHAGIAGASVSLSAPTGTYHTKTGGNGFFSFLGLPVDTYLIAVELTGYQPLSQSGLTITGDQTLSIGNISIEKSIRTIVRTTSRAQSGAFQPTQTIDSYTVGQAQIAQSTGKAASTNENEALLAVPGVTLTNNNTSMASSVTVRGGAAAEVGFQFAGVPFKEPFLGGNGSVGLMNGVGSIQVVEGAGDATQGGVGSGVINVIPQRGSGPGSGLIDTEFGGPNFNHQFAIDYGFSTPDNRISEYFSYNGSRLAPYYGYSNTPLNQFGNAFATTYLANDQFTNNFFFKFGHNLNQQIEVLYANISQQGWGGYTGAGGVYNQATNPNALAYYPYDTLTNSASNYGLTGYTPNEFAQLIGLSPGVPNANLPITNPQQTLSNETRYLMLEYDNNLTPTTYLALKYYNWDANESTDDSYYIGAWQTGFPGLAAPNTVGGQTTGSNLDIVQQLGSKFTVTLNGQYNVLAPEFNAYEPQLTPVGFAITGLTNGPLASDWLPGGYVYDSFCGSTPWEQGGVVGAGPKPSCLPRMPTWGINYNKTIFQNWGTGLRLQYNPTNKVKLDLGVRDEGQIRKWQSQLDQIGQGTPATGIGSVSGTTVPINNPFDVPAADWPNEPTVVQPRGSISWELGNDDSLRFGYGRSAVYANAQTAGTPFETYGLGPYQNLAAKTGSTCGWNSPVFNAGLFPCKTFAQQLYWTGDNVEAPDGENLPPAIYNNYDLSFSHLFTNGWGARVTPFYKQGTSLPTFFLLNPTLGIFAISNEGANKTTGVEFGLTTPQHAFGWSGFMTATYQNVLSTTPPFSAAETTVPFESLATLALGDLYRAGYVSPASLRIGGVEKFKNGFSISPQVEFNVGYPYTYGNMIAGCLVASASNGKCLRYANVPQADFGAGIAPSQSSLVGSNPLASLSTNYYDPAYSGSILDPNIAATRGTPGTSANGGVLSHPNLLGDVTLQWKAGRNTFGVQFLNLFGNAFQGSVPTINTWYQPVATGLSGPQTGVNSCVNEVGTARGCFANVPRESYAFTNGAYLLSNGNFTSTPSYGPIQPFTVQAFYQRAI
jgi:hypothetical protein